jgi:Spy/CpxP family protein refolding chaperone
MRAFVRLLTVIGLTAAAIAVPQRATAQSGLLASNGPSKKFSLEELASQWASLERPLLGVTGLTDEQRDVIEALEEKYRKQMNNDAGPIREARVMVLQRGPFDRQMVEVALMRMKELRRNQLSELRAALTTEQRVKYDANLKQMEAEEEAANMVRERDAAFYVP